MSKKYLCDVEALYNWLPENSKVLSDGSELVFVNDFDGDETKPYCDILSKDGYQVILDGEIHEFVEQNGQWSNIPSDEQSSCVTLTKEEYNVLCKCSG